jgi:hypothetical protein
MKCKLLLLPLCAGLSFYALKTSAKDGVLQSHSMSVTTPCFMENKGQITDQFSKPRKDIDFKLKTGSGLTVFVGREGLHYQWVTTNDTGGVRKGSVKKGNGSLDENAMVSLYRLDVSLVGADLQAPVITDDDLMDDDGSTITPEHYFSFVATLEGWLGDTLVDNVSNELGEYDAIEEPTLSLIFDENFAAPKESIGFERKLFTLTGELCTLLNKMT